MKFRVFLKESKELMYPDADGILKSKNGKEFFLDGFANLRNIKDGSVFLDEGFVVTFSLDTHDGANQEIFVGDLVRYMPKNEMFGFSENTPKTGEIGIVTIENGSIFILPVRSNRFTFPVNSNWIVEGNVFENEVLLAGE